MTEFRVTEFWEVAFTDKQLMWGLEPARSAILAAERVASAGAREVLIPGIGYGRNAVPFLDRGMAVTGIEISATAISLARAELGLTLPIHHGSVADMPLDDRTYDAVFGFALLHLLDAPTRAKVIGACHRQLAPRGHMIFTVIAKEAPMYGRGLRLGDDWYEILPGVSMYFYDEPAVERELGPYGLVEVSRIDEPARSGGTLPFLHAVCVVE